MALPKILKNYNMFANGTSFAGRVDEIELPKLTLKTEEQRGGGTDAPEDVDMGMEKMTCSITSAEHDVAILKLFGVQNGNASQLKFRAAMEDDLNTVGYVVTIAGRCTEMDPGTLKAGEKTPLKATFSLTAYKLELGDEVIYDIDIRNMKRFIMGVDHLAKQKALIQA